MKAFVVCGDQTISPSLCGYWCMQAEDELRGGGHIVFRMVTGANHFVSSHRSFYSLACAYMYAIRCIGMPQRNLCRCIWICWLHSSVCRVRFETVTTVYKNRRHCEALIQRAQSSMISESGSQSSGYRVTAAGDWERPRAEALRLRRESLGAPSSYQVDIGSGDKAASLA